MDKFGMYAAAVSRAPERQAESDGASYLRCQSVTEVQDGGVVIVRTLVETHVVLQGVPQLRDKQIGKKKNRKPKKLLSSRTGEQIDSERKAVRNKLFIQLLRFFMAICAWLQKRKILK